MNNIVKIISALCLGAAFLAVPAAYAQTKASADVPIMEVLKPNTDGTFVDSANPATPVTGPKFEDLQDTDAQTQQYNDQRSGQGEQYNNQQSGQSRVFQNTYATENGQRQRQLTKAQEKYKEKFDNQMLVKDTVDILNRAVQQSIQVQTYVIQRNYEDPMFRQTAEEQDIANRKVMQEQDQTENEIVRQIREAQKAYYAKVLEQQEMERANFKDIQDQATTNDKLDINAQWLSDKGKIRTQQNANAGKVEGQQNSARSSFSTEQASENQAAATALGDRTTGGTWSSVEAPDPKNLPAPTIGYGIYTFGSNLINAPTLFYLLSYMCGTYFMALGLLKANKAARDPSQNPISNAVKFMVAGAFLAALPMVTEILKNSFGLDGTSVFDLDYTKGLAGASGQAQANGTTSADGLDMFMVNLVKDITRPMMGIINLICFASGVFLLFLGLQRLVKGSDQGPKGPAGMGTLMTFMVGAALISFAPSLQLVLTSVFGDAATVATYPNMSTLATKIGTDAANMKQAEAVITALLAFLTIVGLISFARGLFMLKEAADGSQNASLMGSMSHLIAGVCCVNFGVFANMLQKTLNLTGFGIAFGN